MGEKGQVVTSHYSYRGNNGLVWNEAVDRDGEGTLNENSLAMLAFSTCNWDFLVNFHSKNKKGKMEMTATLIKKKKQDVKNKT